MEIGSFIELQFEKGKEYYRGERDVARLNSGRAAIRHAARLLGCGTVHLPYYQCDTVRDFLIRSGVTVKYYRIDEAFDPVGLEPADGEAVLLVNYYGVMSGERMQDLASRFLRVIIDNSQAFFAAPVDGCMNVYSARKFVGVPDGAYVVGPGAERFTDGYPQGYSSDTSLFLLQRIEHGCEGAAYESRTANERRIDAEDVMRMSPLTRAILDGTDYGFIRRKRRENFEIACRLFSDINRIDPTRYYGADCVPMVYPLVVEDDGLLDRLLAAKHFQGHWWSYILGEPGAGDFERLLSRYVIPVTIDQRYGEEELRFVRGLIQ